MAISERCVGDSAEISLSGDFTFSDTNEFRGKLKEVIEKDIKALKIDVSQLQSLDSAGLGMLLVAHSDCQKKAIDFSLYKPTGSVKALLEVTKSYDRFSIVG